MSRSKAARRAFAVGVVVVAAVCAVVTPAAAAWPPVFEPSGQELSFYSQPGVGAPTQTSRLASSTWEADPTDKPLMCKIWPMTPSALPASFRNGYWTYNIDDSDVGTTSNIERFGRPGDTPFCGQTTPVDKSMWEQDSLIVWREGVFYFRLATQTKAVTFGRPTDTPLIGDWDGDSVDEMAVKRGNRYYFATDNITGGGGVRSSTFGLPTDAPVTAASLYLNGVDTLVLRRGNRYLFTGDLPGAPTMQITREQAYGKATDIPLDVENWVPSDPESRQVSVARLGPDS
ncbi:hypothetical protein [Pseudokineococcus sp. 1T1Z-3]|uniref:hypothetical protein n=1 Tax=Pseudokineococcus sp. 1T1Z-3 TaxID=3132745 RepID=UPI003094B302